MVVIVALSKAEEIESPFVNNHLPCILKRIASKEDARMNTPEMAICPIVDVTPAVDPRASPRPRKAATKRNAPMQRLRLIPDNIIAPLGVLAR